MAEELHKDTLVAAVELYWTQPERERRALEGFGLDWKMDHGVGGAVVEENGVA